MSKGFLNNKNAFISFENNSGDNLLVSSKNFKDLSKGVLNPNFIFNSDSSETLKFADDSFAKDFKKEIISTNVAVKVSEDLSRFIETLNNTRKQVENIKIDVENIKKDKIDLVSLLGIFIAIFTFFSIEIQILKSVSSLLGIAGLSSIMFSGIILFIVLIYAIANHWINGDANKFFPKKYLFIVVIFFIIGLFLCALSDFNNKDYHVNYVLIDNKKSKTEDRNFNENELIFNEQNTTTNPVNFNKDNIKK